MTSDDPEFPWRSVASAPRDGTEILVVTHRGTARGQTRFVVWWDAMRTHWVLCEPGDMPEQSPEKALVVGHVVGWMPLPPPVKMRLEIVKGST